MDQHLGPSWSRGYLSRVIDYLKPELLVLSSSSPIPWNRVIRSSMQKEVFWVDRAPPLGHKPSLPGSFLHRGRAPETPPESCVSCYRVPMLPFHSTWGHLPGLI